MRRLNDAQMIQVEKVSFFMGNEPTVEEWAARKFTQSVLVKRLKSEIFFQQSPPP